MKELIKRLDTAVKANDWDEVDKVRAEMKALIDANREEDLEEEVIEESEDEEDDDYPMIDFENPTLDDEGYAYGYDEYGNYHYYYVGHKDPIDRAWEDSGMTWADFA